MAAKPTNPNHNTAVAKFTDAWAAKYQAKYPFRGKDAKSVAFVLAHVGNDLAAYAAVVSAYLADADPFVVNARHTLAVLEARVAQYLTAPQGPTAPGPKLTQRQQQLATNLTNLAGGTP